MFTCYPTWNYSSGVVGEFCNVQLLLLFCHNFLWFIIIVVVVITIIITIIYYFTTKLVQNIAYTRMRTKICQQYKNRQNTAKDSQTVDFMTSVDLIGDCTSSVLPSPQSPCTSASTVSLCPMLQIGVGLFVIKVAISI